MNGRWFTGVLVTFTLTFLLSLSAQAQDSAVGFKAANDLAYQGDYKGAVAAYEAIVEAGMDDSALFLNLGNAYFRNEAYGSAIWAFRRGLNCEPEAPLQESLAYNLEVARAALQARYRASNDGSQFIYTEPGGWLYQLSHTLSLPPLLWTFLGLWWVLCLLLMMRRFKPDKSFGSVATPVGVLALLVGGLLLARVVTDQDFQLGVVIKDEVLMREGPDRHRGASLPEGMEAWLIDATPEWHKIEVPSGRSGWVSTSALRAL